MHITLRPEKPAVQREFRVTESFLAGSATLCRRQSPRACTPGRPAIAELVGASVGASEDSHSPGRSSASVLQGEGARDDGTDLSVHRESSGGEAERGGMGRDWPAVWAGAFGGLGGSVAPQAGEQGKSLLSASATHSNSSQ